MFEYLTYAILTVSPFSENASLMEVDNHLHAEVLCLADNIYHEARSEPTAGQLGVAAVTINRVNDDRFPNTICEVVKQGPTKPSWKTGEPIPIRNRCQFSWYCDGKSDDPQDLTTYQGIYDLSYEIVYGNIDLVDLTDGATHYHATSVNPSWAKTKTKVGRIGNHIFYRWE